MVADKKQSVLTGVVAVFLRGNIPLLLILLSLVAGAIALLVTPREEDPQIVVPLADIMVSYPGGSVEETERLVASRLERMLYQIDGVEYVYSMSQAEMAVITVRFFVGENREDSLIKLYNKLQQNMDRVTPGIAGWVVKPVEIDDVPIVCAALHSRTYDDAELFRLAEEVKGKLQNIPHAGRVEIFGGLPRTVHVRLQPERLSAYGMSPLQIADAVRVSNMQRGVGAVQFAGQELVVEAGPFLRGVKELAMVMVGVHAGRPVYLRDVAEVVDGPAEREQLTRFLYGPADPLFVATGSPPRAAVTLAVGKQKGSNAVNVSREVQERLKGLGETLLPAGVDVRITRDYGATADDKVNNLVVSLALAVLTVIGLLAFTMNWRAGAIVALAAPISYSLTLLVNMLMGYTINRVTLFALILSLGLLVDDPIASVENIERHLRLKRGKDRLRTIIGAMDEIMPPVVLSTLAIMIAFTPMFFISGMMGPYMQPMAMNVPIAVLMSTVVALTITPWLCSKILKHQPAGKVGGAEEDQSGASSRMIRIYERVLGPFVDNRRKAYTLLIVVGVLFTISVGLALTGLVPLKMLPFDNKNEFQLLVDMPEGTTLARTDSVVRELEAFVCTIPEVTDVTSTVGGASPMDFNGMVRHYYLRRGAHVADLRVNLLHRTKRKMGSHAIALRIRNDLDVIAERTGAVVKLIEVPPGPPVLSTLVAEVYGPFEATYAQLIEAAGIVKARLTEEPGVVDLDDSVEAPQMKLRFEVDRDKAARNGISVSDVVQTVTLAVQGMDVGILHLQGEQSERMITLRLRREDRSLPARLETLPVAGRGGQVVQLGELGSFVEETVSPTIMHKNQERVVFVTSEVAGRGPAYPVLAVQKHFEEHPLPHGARIDWRGEGEWKITLDVFRDLGIAFSVALLGIYVLLVYETGSYLLPVVIMLSIPLTMIGIMPGFWILNIIAGSTVGGYSHMIFFTATAMIGMIALSGIVVRNAIVLIDFIRKSADVGMPMRQAIIESGAVRMRPILLTAGTTLLGTWPITFDPIFSGLAWALIFGLVVSTAFTLVVIPTVYNLLYGSKED